MVLHSFKGPPQCSHLMSSLLPKGKLNVVVVIESRRNIATQLVMDMTHTCQCLFMWAVLTCIQAAPSTQSQCLHNRNFSCWKHTFSHLFYYSSNPLILEENWFQSQRAKKNARIEWGCAQWWDCCLLKGSKDLSSWILTSSGIHYDFVRGRPRKS